MELRENYEARYWIKVVVYRKVLDFAVSFIFIGYLILWDFLSITLIVPIVLIIFSKLLLIIASSFILKNRKQEKRLIISYCLEILFWLLLIPVILKKLDLVYSGIPLYISTLFITLIDYRHPSSFVVASHILDILCKWSNTLTFLCFALRIQKIISWDWIYIFWPVWLIIVLGVFTALIYTIGIFLFKKRERDDLSTPLWLVFIVITTSLGFGGFVVGICELFGDDNHEFFRATCYIFLSVSMLNFMIFKCNKKKFMQWLLLTFTVENSESFSVKLQFQKALKSFVTSLSIYKVNSTLYKVTPEKQGEQNENDNRKENEENNSVKECLVCMANECDSVFLPCGHGGICNKCALKLLESEAGCHICRVKIERVIKMRGNLDFGAVVTEIDRD